LPSWVNAPGAAGYADHIDDSPKHTICGRGIVSCDPVMRLLQIVLRER
jgi:hypothetical protein